MIRPKVHISAGLTSTVNPGEVLRYQKDIAFEEAKKALRGRRWSKSQSYELKDLVDKGVDSNIR